MKLPLAIVLLAVGSIGLCAPSASAIDGPPSWYGGYAYGYLYSNLDYKIPYHAAYPPVYYSYPVPRTYGYSPFAYPPATMTPEIVKAPVTPTTILNPYVQQKDEKAEMKDKTAAASAQPKPLVIYNPHIKGSRSLVQVSK